MDCFVKIIICSKNKFDNNISLLMEVNNGNKPDRMEKIEKQK